MNAGHEVTLLVRTAIHDEINRLAADVEVIQERAAFGGGAVSGNVFALLFEVWFAFCCVAAESKNGQILRDLEKNVHYKAPRV